MKAGEKTRCPHCGEDTVVKSKPKMEGWTRVGDVLVCALCGGELGVPEKADGEKNSSSAAALAALLGEAPAPKLRLDPGAGHKRFCRNCRRLIEHPFVLRCGLDGREIDPGGCCANFSPREELS